MQNKQQLGFPSEELILKCPGYDEIEEAFLTESIGNEIERRDLQIQYDLVRSLTETKKHHLRLRKNQILQKKFNRYPEQDIYDSTRVIVDGQYINANYIPNFKFLGKEVKAIIGQAPIPNSIQHFWATIKQEKIDCVVMLCNLEQKGKVKCHDYFSQYATGAKPLLENETLTIKELQNKETSTMHLHYKTWPDKSVPLDIRQLYELVQQIKKIQPKSILIHCSAGLGRSGVFAAILMLVDKIQQGKLSIIQVVRKLREYRWKAVQNHQQYEFIYKFVEFYKNQMKTKDT